MAGGWYVFSAIRPEKVWMVPIRGPKWPRKHSPGFTLGNCPQPGLALKGQPGTARTRFEPLNQPLQGETFMWAYPG
jgi:hypothetical protein